jgi:short-subunit dehydrogenase
VMFNNAGIGYFAAFEESDEAEARRLMEINLFGLAATTKAVLPGMRRRGSGTILNVSSIGGQRSFPAVSWYNASKFAVEGLSEPLAPV